MVGAGRGTEQGRACTSSGTPTPMHLSLDGNCHLSLHVRKKGDNPVDVLAGEIWAYSTQGSRELQEDRLAFVTQQRAASISWLTLSDCPFFHGW